MRAAATVLAIGLVLFALGSELLVRQAIRGDNAYEDYRARFRTTAASAIAIGDSRTAANIDGGSGLENLGNPADDLAIVIAKLEARHRLRPLTRVVLQADPHQFAAYRLFKDSEGKLEDLLGTPPPLAFLRPHYRQYLFAYWRIALADPRRFLGAPPTGQPAAETPPLRPGTPAWDELAASRVQFHVPLAGTDSQPVMRRYREVVAALKRDGVAVCLVTHPVSAAYRAAAARYPSFAAARAAYDRVARDLGVARADLWDAVDDAAFGDTDHLAPRAAAGYTREVLARCFGA